MHSLFLAEIGCEELPPGDLDLALESMPELLKSRLLEEGLQHGRVSVLGTPRRIAVMVESVAPAQEDRVEEFRGPSESQAFDQEGNPTKAAIGFARGRGVSVEDLTVRDTDNGRYVFAQKVRKGEAAPAVLSRALGQVLDELKFPRRMFWGPQQRFPRPVRWILALLDETVVKMELFGVRAGRVTFGNRALSPGPREVPRAGDYLDVLADLGVMVDPESRRDMIRRDLDRAAGELGGMPAVSAELLDQVVGMVERPAVSWGRFDDDFCRLPAPVLETTMRVHQKCFAVMGEEGNILPYFLFVKNGDERGLDRIRRGYERVMGARLADARFFFEEDRSRRLEEFNSQLERVVFMEGLGSMADKVGRLERLSRILGEMLGLESGLMEDLKRAALLSKADLVTHVVREFPELEGIMGREYALMSGEKPEVARAIYEHYLPRGAGDAVPETMLGTVLAISDRLDTLAGAFTSGIRPTGSQDPYGLRRRALGVVEILSRANLDLPLDRLLKHAVAGYSLEDGQDTTAGLMDFIQTRVRALLVEEGYRHDVVEAVLRRQSRVIPEIRERIVSSTEFLRTDQADHLLSLHRRAENLSRKLSRDEEEAEVSPELFEAEEEREVHRQLEAARERIGRLEQEGDFRGMMEAACTLKEPVDKLLDEVLIMAEDPEIKRNRLLLLRAVSDLASRVADWSHVVR